MLGFAWFAIALPQPMGSDRTDAVVVVTGGGGRIARGLQVLESEWAARMLISGVDREVKAAELAKEYNTPVRLFACCIDLGFAATDTRSNGQEVADWIKRSDYMSIRLVTTDWHMRRAKYEIEQALPDEVTVSADAVQGKPTLAMLFLEYHKYLLSRGASMAKI